jgi:RTX calcium-binding nonapeptide repeat (4 copies)
VLALHLRREVLAHVRGVTPGRFFARLRWGVLVALVAVSGAAASPAARAATVSLEQGVLSYRADPGERNSPLVWVRRSAGELAIEVNDHRRVRLVAGTGCIVAGDTDGDGVEDVRCSLTAGAALPRVRVALGDAADTGSVSRLPGRIAGGPGSDVLTGGGLLDGGPGNDSLTVTRGEIRKARGGPGDDELEVDTDVTAGTVLEGGPGEDRLNGGDGRDVLRGGPGDDRLGDVGDEGADVYRLGPGSDRTYSWGADTIFARDGTYDQIECGGRESIILDGLDFYDQEGARCRRVRRRGLARVMPDTGVVYFEEDSDQYAGPNELEIPILCPYDGPRPCAGTLTVSDRQGIVVDSAFRVGFLGRWYDGYRMGRPALRRLAKWARITVVSYDRAGRLHRHSIAGPGAVVINEPGYCC